MELTVSGCQRACKGYLVANSKAIQLIAGHQHFEAGTDLHRVIDHIVGEVTLKIVVAGCDLRDLSLTGDGAAVIISPVKCVL